MGDATQRSGSGGALSARLAREPYLILDGALATELERRGHDLRDSLWSAAVLLRDPAAIEAVHREYVEAGADILTSASYQASLPALVQRGMSQRQAEDVLTLSVALARAAAREATPPRREPPLVAASIGSYGAALADGSEYRGDYPGVDEAALLDFHLPRMEVLAAHADVLACETVPCLLEVRALSRALAQTLPRHPGLEAFVAVSCRDEQRLCHGEPIEACIDVIADVPGVVAFGINCTAPGHAEALVRRTSELASARGLAVLAYPNAGESWNAAEHTWSGGGLEAAAFAAAARRWVAAGATLVGGCCRTTPAYIQALARDREVARREPDRSGR